MDFHIHLPVWAIWVLGALAALGCAFGLFLWFIHEIAKGMS